MRNIIPKLGLNTIKDSDLNKYALDKIKKVGTNAAFAAVSPTVAQLQTKRKQYDKALVKSIDGSRANTAKKNTKRKELEQMLTLQAKSCAKIAAGNLALFLSSGYEAKDTVGKPVGTLDQALNMRMHPTEAIGELKAKWQPTKHARNYLLRCYTDEQSPETSVIFFDVFSASKATIKNMPSGKRIYVQVRANGGSTGHGAWSEPVWDRPR